MQPTSSHPIHDERSLRTFGRHMRLAHRLGLQLHHRPPGFRESPELVRLDVLPGRTPSDKPPVRIFMGTEPAQHRAERVLIWSIMAVRDPSRVYEIYLMSDLAGFDRRHWKTGFTGYRYAIPFLAGGDGRAIYNDVDQIYLADPAELFDLDMKGAGMMSITERDTSVMLIDCAKMAGVWSLEEARTMRRHKVFRVKTASAGVWGRLGGEWNARDPEFDPGRSKLLHYTILHTQPWRPFPKQLKYEPNPLGNLWFDLECDADANGFTIFTRARPSKRFGEIAAETRPPATAEHRPRLSARDRASVEKLAAETGSRTIALWDLARGGDFLLHQLVEGGKEGAGAERRCDGIVASETINRIPKADLHWVLDEIFRTAAKFVHVAVPRIGGLFGRAKGDAALAETSDAYWWRTQMEGAARRRPGVRWALRIGRTVATG